MVIIKELRIKEGYLRINLEIEDSEYYEDCQFDKITIQTHRDYLENPDNITLQLSATGKSFEDKLQLDTGIYDIKSDDLLFINVYWQGNPAINAPCGSDENPYKYIVYNKALIYNIGIQYLSELTNCCADKTGMINFILMKKYFELCLLSGNLLEAINLWDALTKGSTSVSINNCGCNG